MGQKKIEGKLKITMTTPTQQKLRDKTVTARKWAEMVRPGDWINRGGPGSDTLPTMEALCARLGEGPGDLNRIEIWTQGGMMNGSNYFVETDPEGKYHVNHEQFLLPKMRSAAAKGYKGLDWKHWGWASGMDIDYARFYRKDKLKRAMDWGVQAVAVPEGGYVNGSYGVNNFMIVAKSCKKFVCEIREDYAWCEAGRNVVLPIDEVDYFVEVDVNDEKYQWPYVNEKEARPDEIQTKIAENILSIMRDGDCIQVGIGTLPSAVVIALSKSGLRHLGVHTEMLGEFAFTLTEAGVIDNSKKNIDIGRCTWAYLMPLDTPRYYEWLHRNPYFCAADVGWTNNITTLSQLDNLVTINNFAQMDLRGQDCAANVGGRPLSGTGGQFEFVLGASMAKGGRAILAATARDARGKSRFVNMLEPGSIVSVPDWLVSWVCTEYGIVNLMGCTDAEKARKIISIAHPDDREDLEKAARHMGLKPDHWMFESCPDRRFPTSDELRDHKFGYVDMRVSPRPIACVND